MKKPASALVEIAFTTFAVAAAGGCSAPQVQFAPSRAVPIWKDTGTPPATIVMERETRYYRDETGAIWDDRGRKVGGAS